MKIENTVVLAVNDLDWGGAQRTVVEEANEFVRRGIPVIVVVTLHNPKMGLAALLDARVRIETFQFHSLSDVRAYWRLVRFWRVTRPRAVVSNLFFTNTVVRLSKILVPSLSVYVREGNVLIEKSFGVKITDIFLSIITKCVFVNAQALVRPIKSVNPLTRVEVLFNGIDGKFFAPSSKRSEMRQALQTPEDTFVITSVGSLTEKKGHIYLLNAMKQLPLARCFIVGEGYMRKTLEKRAPENVVFLGARSDIRDIYAASDVFVLSSMWEGMPNAMLEALAAGLPVVTTDVGGASELVRDGENGFLVPTRDSEALAARIAMLMNDHELRNRLAKNAAVSVHHLTWQKHADRLLSVI